MILHRFTDASKFYDRVKDYLLLQEVENCLILGILRTLIDSPERYKGQPYLASVEAGSQTIAVAVITSVYKLVLSKMEDLEAAKLIAQDLCDRQQLPGVTALAAEAFSFANAWQTLTGQSYQPGMQMRIHKLQAVEPVTRANGYLRNAALGDRPMLLQWYEAFEMEVFGSIHGDAERFVNHQLKENTLYIWEDIVPVTMVCCAGKTPNSTRIGPVYTPEEYRRKGYATTCVADLSRKLLEENCQFCCLFTDLANPTSNKIYQKIGYQPIADWCEYTFDMSGIP